MPDPVKLLTDDMGPRSILLVIIGAGALLVLSSLVYDSVGAGLDSIFSAVDPGMANYAAEVEAASIGEIAD